MVIYTQTMSAFGFTYNNNIVGVGNGNLDISGTLSTLTATVPGYHAQWTLNGGGTVTYTASGNLLWSHRVVAIPIEKSELGSSGYVDIYCPTSGTITYYSGNSGTSTKTCTAAGVPLSGWDALWYVIMPGMGYGSDQTRLVATTFSNSTWKPDSNWILLAVRNGDTLSSSLRWIPGQVTFPGTGGVYNTATGFNNWDSTQWTTSSSNILYNTGNIGIGVTSIGAKLDVSHNGTTPALEVNQLGTGRILDLQKSGSSQLVVDTSGNVGIGVTNPTNKLQIDGTTVLAANRQLRLEGGSGTTTLSMGGAGAISVDAPSVIGGRFLLNDSGNVGIGISAPSARLDVSLNGTTPVLKLNQAGSGAIMDLQKSGSTQLILDTNGNLGIGLTNPSNKVHVQGGIRLEGETSVTVFGGALPTANLTNTYITFGAAGSSSDWAYLRQIGGNNEYTLALDLYDDSLSEGFQIRHVLGGGVGSIAAVPFAVYNRNVGINLTTPTTSFDVSSNNTSGALRVNQTSSGRILDLQKGGTTQVVVDTSGNLGIGLTNPTSKLHVLGDTRIQGNLTVNGTTTVIDTNTSTTEQLVITNDGTGPAVVINQIGAQNILDVQDDSVSVLRVIDGGNVGIGLVNPSARLDVSHNGSTPALEANQTGSGRILELQKNGTAQVVVDNNGNMAIGKATAATTLDVAGTVTALSFAGSGANVTNLNMNAAATGILSVSRGGTGAGTLTSGQLLVGNTTGAVIQSANLSWDNGTNTLTATNLAGSGVNVTNISAGNINTGTLAVARGGTGATTSTGSGSVMLNNAPTFSGTMTGGTFSGTHTGTGSGLTGLSAGNINAGTLAVSYGGIGVTTITAGRIMVGNGNSAIISSANLTWDNTNNTLTATNLAGTGANITGLSASNINAGFLPVLYGGTGTTTSTGSGSVMLNNAPTFSGTMTGGTFSGTHTGTGAGLTGLSAGNINAGTLAVSYGGIGVTTLASGQLLVGNGTGAVIQSSNLSWDNTNGRLGLGTTQPAHRLHVAGGSLQLENVGATGENPHVFIKFKETNFNDSFGIGCDFSGTGDSNRLMITASTTNADPAEADARLTILQGGNVGIGVTNPSYKLHIKDGTTYLEGVGGTGGSEILTLISADTWQSSLSIRNTSAVNSWQLNVGGSGNSAIGSGNLGFFVGPANRYIMSLTAGGNVGIGLTNPSARLDVSHNGTTPALEANQTGSGRILELQKNGTAQVVVDNNGNLGVGQTNPSRQLDVSGYIRTMSLETNANNGNYFALNSYWNGSAWTKYASGQGGFIIRGDPSHRVQLYTQDPSSNTITERMTFLYGNGNVGIGTTNPALALDVSGATVFGTASLGRLVFGAGMPSGERGLEIYYDVGNNYTQVQSIHAGTAYRPLCLNPAGGNVGIGLTDPGYKLDVNGSIRIISSSESHYQNGYDYIYTQMTTIGTTRGRIGVWNANTGPGVLTLNDVGGNVGIGTTNPGYTLDVAGDINFTGTLRQNGTAFSGSRWTTSGSNILYNTGNVGIGITNPSARLDVSHNGTTPALEANQTGTGNILELQKNGVAQLTVDNNGILNTVNASIPGYHAQWTLNGGGTVTYTSDGNLLWSNRVIAIPIEKSEQGSEGFIDITCPTSGTITYFSGASGSTTVTCTATGIPMASWTALWYVMTPGMGSSSDQTRFRLTLYTNSDWKPNSNWILLAVRNGDGAAGCLRWIPGQVTFPNTGGVFNTGTGTNNWSGWVSSGSDIYNTVGNVGIGLTNPGAKAHVYQASQTSHLLSTNFASGVNLALQDANGSPGNGGMMTFGANQGHFAAIKGYIRDGTENTVGALFFATRNAIADSTLTPRLWIELDGKVGIGKTNPGYTLDVSGDINFTGTLRQNGTAFSGGGSSQWTTSGTDIYYTTGKVGIGLTNPQAPLHVTGGARIDGYLDSVAISGLGAGRYPSIQYYRLNSDLVGANSNGVQRIFGVGVTLVANTVYEFDLHVRMLKTTGSTSHTVAVNLIGNGNATIASLLSGISFKEGTLASLTSGSESYFYLSILNTTGAIRTFSPSNGTNYHFLFKLSGMIAINTGGTLIPSYQCSAAPGGAWSTAAGSYMKIWPVGPTGSNISIGSWA
jgi:fibronectin-binding autotransporter adhesin